MAIFKDCKNHETTVWCESCDYSTIIESLNDEVIIAQLKSEDWIVSGDLCFCSESCLTKEILLTSEVFNGLSDKA